MGAAALMLEAGVGILRTLPPARDGSLAKLRRTAGALGISWPVSTPYPEFVRGLDATVPAHAAMLNACTMLFRGAGYPVSYTHLDVYKRQPRFRAVPQAQGGRWL